MNQNIGHNGNDDYPASPILIVDDEEQTLLGMRLVLRSNGLNNVVTESDSRRVEALLANQPVSLVLLDLSMPHVSGEELLGMLRSEHSDVPVVIVSGANDIETAVRCMREGAFDYVVKPVERNRLIPCIQRAIHIQELQGENRRLKQHILTDKLEKPEAFRALVTGSKRMRAIFRYVESIAGTPQPVLITGETGVGKELMAQAIHEVSGRRGAFVPVNVAGLDDHVFSDTLFGHKRGAFTGATDGRKGLVETAAGGTLFLDEIGDLSHSSQVKLLRILQEREYYPLGSDVAKRSDARIVCATNKPLETLMQGDQFRRDLYFRLQTHHIQIPPLRERMEDIPLITRHLLEESASRLGKKTPTPPKQLFTLLQTYSFPGNIRELESMVYDAVSKHGGRVLSLEVFQQRIFGETPSAARLRESLRGHPDGLGSPRVSYHEELPTLKEAANLLIGEAMRRADNNQSIASKMLGITQQALSKRLRGASNSAASADE